MEPLDCQTGTARKSFELGYLERHRPSHEILRTVRLLGEFKGREALYPVQAPQVLDMLRQVAVIQSTESSNRIEGVTAPAKHIEAIVAEKTTTRNRSEQEIADYRDVLNLIHGNYDGIDLSSSVVLQLHRDLIPRDARGGLQGVRAAGRQRLVDSRREVTQERRAVRPSAVTEMP